ncbi:hypothetical protein GCM10027578_09150 [Spirosoma luteolum]
MWYFQIRQSGVDYEQYRQLQQLAELTEVELFNEPYENWYLFSVDRDQYRTFADTLDRTGIAYELRSHRPQRDELLAMMR